MIRESNFTVTAFVFVHLSEMIDTSLKSDCNLKLLSSGSPADKADLEVADEILEINGKALQNCSHTEVISHIHNVSVKRIMPVTLLFMKFQARWA